MIIDNDNVEIILVSCLCNCFNLYLLYVHEENICNYIWRYINIFIYLVPSGLAASPIKCWSIQTTSVEWSVKDIEMSGYKENLHRRKTTEATNPHKVVFGKLICRPLAPTRLRSNDVTAT